MSKAKYIFHVGRDKKYGFYPTTDIEIDDNHNTATVKFSRFKNNVCCKRKVKKDDLSKYIFSEEEIINFDKLKKYLKNKGYRVHERFDCDYFHNTLFNRDKLLYETLCAPIKNGSYLSMPQNKKLKYLCSRIMHFKLNDYHLIPKEIINNEETNT